MLLMKKYHDCCNYRYYYYIEAEIQNLPQLDAASLGSLKLNYYWIIECYTMKVSYEGGRGLPV